MPHKQLVHLPLLHYPPPHRTAYLDQLGMLRHQLQQFGPDERIVHNQIGPLEALQPTASNQHRVARPGTNKVDLP